MFLATFRPTFQEQTPSYSAFAVRLGSKSENRANLNNDSGFSSMPPSTSTSSSTSPPESSSNTGDSDSDQDKVKERRRPKSKKLLTGSAGGVASTPGWVSAVSPLSSSICEKCEAGEVSRQQLEAEVEKLNREVTSTRQTVLRLHEREEKMKER